MNRRAFIGTLGLGLLAAPLAAGAQPAGKIFRIGILGLGSSELLRQTLREVGYVEGLNLALEWRDPEGKTERFGDLAADLVRLKVDVIVAINPKLHVNDATLFAVTVEKPGGVVVSKRERIVVTAQRG